MSKNDNGGPAFPIPASCGPMGDYLQPDSWGMSLRDYFAAAALQGILAAHAGEQLPGERTAIAAAFVYADAMLKARSA